MAFLRILSRPVRKRPLTSLRSSSSSSSSLSSPSSPRLHSLWSRGYFSALNSRGLRRTPRRSFAIKPHGEPSGPIKSPPQPRVDSPQAVPPPSPLPKRSSLSVGVASIPDPQKTKGEDASFVFHHKPEVGEGEECAGVGEWDAIGVADGVGGWANHGVDPSLYSNSLMSHCRQEAEKYCSSGPSAMVDPAELLRLAHSSVTSLNIPGSSTACLVGVDAHKIRVVNLGDSGCLVLRPLPMATKAGESEGESEGEGEGEGESESEAEIKLAANYEVAFRSIPQCHAFNTPLQLGSGSDDLPGHADIHDVLHAAGDVIVVGSDGLFDNLNELQIITCVRRALHLHKQMLNDSCSGGKGNTEYLNGTRPTPLDNDASEKVEEAMEQGTFVARELATLAHRVAACPKQMKWNRPELQRPTPFAQACWDEGHHWAGGKMDDITIVVACL